MRPVTIAKTVPGARRYSSTKTVSLLDPRDSADGPGGQGFLHSAALYEINKSVKSHENVPLRSSLAKFSSPVVVSFHVLPSYHRIASRRLSVCQILLLILVAVDGERLL